MIRQTGKKQGRQPSNGRTRCRDAVLSDRRRRRPSRGNGRRSWLRGHPTTQTQKGGKNAGRSPRYDARPAAR